MSRHRFAGMNPVRQRPIGVNPSQGGFFSVPADERNFGQQASLPYDQQLNMNHQSNFAHSNASGCGYSNANHQSNFAHSNFAHSNFVSGGNPNAIWSGAQTNVGPQDRIFAGNYASGRRGVAQGGVQRGLLPQQMPVEKDLGCKNICAQGIYAGASYRWVNGRDCACKDRSGGGGPRIMSEADARFFRENFQPTPDGQYAMRRR